jgi:hypothetical protein
MNNKKNKKIEKTNFLELISWDAAICSATQEIPKILQNSECSLPCSQEPSTGPYLKQDQSIPHHFNLFL